MDFVEPKVDFVEPKVDLLEPGQEKWDGSMP